MLILLQCAFIPCVPLLKTKKGQADHLLASTRLRDCKGPHLSAGKGTESIRKGHNYGGRKYKETNSLMPGLFQLYADIKPLKKNLSLTVRVCC